MPGLRRARLRLLAATMLETRWCAARLACAADYGMGAVRGPSDDEGKADGGNACAGAFGVGKDTVGGGDSSRDRRSAGVHRRGVAWEQDQAPLATHSTLMQVDAGDTQHEGGRGLGL